MNALEGAAAAGSSQQLNQLMTSALVGMVEGSLAAIIENIRLCIGLQKDLWQHHDAPQ